MHELIAKYEPLSYCAIRNPISQLNVSIIAGLMDYQNSHELQPCYQHPFFEIKLLPWEKKRKWKDYYSQNTHVDR